MGNDQFICSEIWQYCLKNTKSHSNLLKSLEYETQKYVNGSQMLSGKIVTKFLQFFIKVQQPKICVDLGTYTGFSAIAMAIAAPNNALIFTIDKVNHTGNELAKKYINSSATLRNKITMISKDAIHAINNLPDRIDFIFIDADKKRTKIYFELLLPKLTSKGIVIVDDVLWRSQVLNPVDKRAKALDEFNQYIHNHPELDNFVLPIRHGLNVITKI